MEPAAVVTLVIAGLIVLVLVGFLIALATVLWRASLALEAIVIRLDPAPERNETVQAAIEAINSDLDQGRASLEALLHGGRLAARFAPELRTEPFELGPDRPVERGAVRGAAASRADNGYRQR